jgi:hypothetical protein
MDEDLDNMSGSDFDDDEDPDKIEVPGQYSELGGVDFVDAFSKGGGKDLAAAASIQETRESKMKQEDMIKNEMKPPPMNMGGNSKMGGNMSLGPYDMMRNSSSKLTLIVWFLRFERGRRMF